MTTEAPWLDQAKKDLDLIEIPGPKAASRIKQMFFTVGHKEVTSDEVSWCAAAVGCWLRETGYPTSQPVKLNLTGRSYEDYGKACAPKKGAIVVSTYTRLGVKDWRRHVGIIATDPRPGAKSYKVIGGNQSDSVSFMNIPIKRVTATRWPTHTEEAPLPNQPAIAPEGKPVAPAAPPAAPAVPAPRRGYSKDFRECLTETLVWEGGYSNDPYDSGGATQAGVTTERYRQYRRVKGLKPRSVKRIERHEVDEIYHDYYWQAVMGDRLPDGIDLAVFDFRVNGGPAVHSLQRALGVRADGLIGPITLEALEGVDVEKAVREICAARLAYVKKLKVFWRFGRGWTNRINGIRRAAIERAGFDDGPLAAVPQHPESANAISAEQGRTDEDPEGLDPRIAGGAITAGGGIVGAASQTSVPTPPSGTVEQLSAWQHAASFFQSFFNTIWEYWPFYMAALAVWALVSYGVPALYRRYRK
jgi:uncharacterized protein (TIGR02594 family)